MPCFHRLNNSTASLRATAMTADRRPLYRHIGRPLVERATGLGRHDAAPDAQLACDPGQTAQNGACVAAGLVYRRRVTNVVCSRTSKAPRMIRGVVVTGLVLVWSGGRPCRSESGRSPLY